MTEENNQPISGSIQLDEPTKETYTFNVVKGYWDNPNNSALSFSNRDIKQILKVTIGGEFIWCDDPIDRIENGVYSDMQWMQPFLRKMYQFTHQPVFGINIETINEDNSDKIFLVNLTKEETKEPFTKTKLTILKTKDLNQVYMKAEEFSNFLGIPFDNACDNAYKLAKDLQDKNDNDSKEP